MALVVKDRVKETTTTAGTGTLTLAGAVTGFQSFSVIGNGNTTYYAIVDSVNGTWEVGIGTYTSSGTTLSRDTILESSTGGSAVSFAAGTKDVFCTYPAERSVYVDGSSIVPATTATLAVSSGGTGLSSGTSGGIPYFSSTSTIASSGILTASAIMLGGGAGAAPTTTTTGNGVVTAIGNSANTSNGLVTQVNTLTASALLLGGGSGTGISSTTTGNGVVTALGFNTGTAGAFVVNGGALGTPLSGTVTNLTGTASININGTVGATTPSTGVFTQVDITAQGDLRLQDTTGGEYVALQAPGTLASSYTLTLPVDDGTSGQVLTTNGSGVLSWTTNGAGDVVGPASSTDNAVVRFDGTTGKLVQNSAVTIADTTGDITGGKYNGITFTTSTGTFTLTNGKTLSVTNTLTLSGTDSTTMTFPGTSQTIAGLAVSGQTFTTAQTFRAASAVRVEAAATQDAVVIAGRAGGTSSYEVTITPTTLSADRTLTLPDATTTVVGTDTTQTLSNKTITQRVSSTTSITSPLAWNSDNFDLYEATAQAGNLTINADSGTPTDARKIIFRITSDATPRVITFTGGASKAFKPIGTNLTVSGSNFTYTLTASKTTYFGAIYDTTVARWEVVALSQEV